MLDKTLLEVLVCPKTKAALVQLGDKLYSTDRKSRMVYPIRDDIPIMLIDQAETISVDEFDRVMKEHEEQKGEADSEPESGPESEVEADGDEDVD